MKRFKLNNRESWDVAMLSRQKFRTSRRTGLSIASWQEPLPLWAPASSLYETMTIITWEPNQTRNKSTLCLNVFDNILTFFSFQLFPFAYPPFWIFTQVTAVHCSLFHVPRFPIILDFSHVFPWLITTYLFKYKTQHLSYFKITVT